MSCESSDAGVATKLVGALSIVGILATAYFLLEMTWLLQPVLYMAAQVAGLLGGD